MKWVLWRANKGYERALGPSLVVGAAACGDEIIVRPMDEYRGPEGAGGIIFGVVRREILWDYQRAGIPVCYLDKGFIRDRIEFNGELIPKWWRLCVNATHPTDYLMDVDMPGDRWAATGVQAATRGTKGRKIIIAGSSAKFHETMLLPPPTEWTADVVRRIRERTDAEIVYRPKPSWRFAEPVPGTTFDHGAKTRFADLLADASCVVTWGSIASVDANLAGVPTIVLGNAPARPVSATDLDLIDTPYVAPEALRTQWLANLAYCQWTPSELTSGQAWGGFRAQMTRRIDEASVVATRNLETGSRI